MQRKIYKYISLLIIFLITLTISIQANIKIGYFNEIITSDTSGKKIDSLKKNLSFLYIDCLKRLPDSLDMITRKGLRLLDYENFSDLFDRSNGFYTFYMGNTGQINPLFYNGLDWRNVNIFIDGIPFSDPFMGMTDFLLLPIDDVSGIEILPSSESFLFGSGGAAKSINLITNKITGFEPFTQIRHVESPYETFLTDCVYNQNITRNSNVMVGFNYQTSTGRFTNMEYTEIGVRTRLRFNLSDKINLILSDNYYKNDRGLNGGINYLATDTNGYEIYDEKLAIVKYPNLQEKKIRNDFNIALVSNLLSDSLDKTRLTISLTNQSDKLNDPNDEKEMIFQDEKINSLNLNINLKQELKYLDNSFLLDCGVNYIKSDFNPWIKIFEDQELTNKKTSLWLSLYNSINILEKLSINLFGRYNYFKMSGYSLQDISSYEFLYKNSAQNFSFGFNSEMDFTKFKIKLEYSNYYRDFGLNEFYLSASPNALNPEHHSYYALNLFYESGFISSKIHLFFRNIKDPLLSINNDLFRTFKNQNISGSNLSLNLKYGRFYLESDLSYIFKNEVEGISSTFNPKTCPDLNARIGLYFKDTMITKNINIKVGLNAGYSSGYKGIEYYPKELRFSIIENMEYTPKTILNFFGVLNIQSAYIYITIENLLDVKYFRLPYYPLNDRSFKLAVTWFFND